MPKILYHILSIYTALKNPLEFLKSKSGLLKEKANPIKISLLYFPLLTTLAY